MFKKNLTRREALKSSLAAGSLAAIGLPLASCGRNEPDTGTPADGLAPAGTGAVSVDDLARQIRGDLLTRDSLGYDAMRKVWNGMIDRYPLAIARCRDVDDVVACVTFAHGNGIPATVRGGGHNVAGKAVRDDALMIDLSEIGAINVDAVAKRATAGGGARWAAFDAATLQHDLYTTGGTVSSTGVGAQYGQRPAHRNRVVATQMYEGTGPGARCATGGMQAHYVLLTGEGFNSEYGRIFDKQGAAMRCRGDGSS
jgi:FAD/FMN-containing dehydrogenase